MIFNEVFPKVKECAELNLQFANVEVKRIVRTDKGKYLDIYTCSSKDALSKENIKNMEEFLEKKLFEGRIGVRLDFFFQPASKPGNAQESKAEAMQSQPKGSNYSNGGYSSKTPYKRKGLFCFSFVWRF